MAASNNVKCYDSGNQGLVSAWQPDSELCAVLSAARCRGTNSLSCGIM